MTLQAYGSAVLNAVSGFDLQVDITLPGQGVTAVIGASGSGKTSLLRALAGLDRHPDMTVIQDGNTWQDATTWVPPHQRPLTLIAQHPALFPHLTVLGNLRCVPNAGDVDAAIERFDLARLLDRTPGKYACVRGRTVEHGAGIKIDIPGRRGPGRGAFRPR